MSKTREYHIDFLKTIGILMLFLAHVEAPTVIKEIRMFDVPLMIFISGYLSKASFSKEKNLRRYLRKRIERLLIPTWIFLIVFYLCMFLVGHAPEMRDVIRSFLLLRDSGIAGYVWIILIYLLCAFAQPLLVKVAKSKHYVIIIIIVSLLYEFLAGIELLTRNEILYYTFFSVIPYGVFMTIGMNYESYTKKQKKVFFLFSIVLFVLIAGILVIINGEYQSISRYKYPARVYYFSYSFPIIVLLLELTKMLDKRDKLPHLEVVTFMSQNSLWIYLWHIMLLAVVNYVFHIKIWTICYIIVLVGSITLAWIQKSVVSLLEKKTGMYIWRFFKG